jgi:hypothetical protein
MVELDRRQFLAGAAVTVPTAPLVTFGRAGALGKADRELAAIGGATEWLNCTLSRVNRRTVTPDRPAAWTSTKTAMARSSSSGCIS